MTHDQPGQSLRSHFLVLISSLSGLLHELRSVLDFKFTIPSIVIQSLIIDFLFYPFPFLSFFSVFSKAYRIYPFLILGHWLLIFGCSIVCCATRWT